MTFAKTQSLVNAIEQVETWANAIAREQRKDDIDWTRMSDLEKYLEEAKETIFNIASE